MYMSFLLRVTVLVCAIALLTATPAAAATIDLPPPSGGDDTQALRSRISTAPAGSVIRAQPDATYKVSDTITIAQPDVTVDLRGATLDQASRPLGNMLLADSVFDVLGSRVTIMDGTIRSTAPFGGISLVAGKMRLIFCTGSVIRGMKVRHSGNPSSAVVAYAAPRTTIRNLDSRMAGIVGLGSSGLTVDSSKVEGTPADTNAISAIAYLGFPIHDVSITDNEISGYGRWAIELTLGGLGATPYDIARPVITGNTIEAPRAGTVEGAISSLGYRGRIEDNVVDEPRGYGIEAGSLENMIRGNKVIRSQPPGPGDAGFGIVVDSRDRSGLLKPATVEGNRIERAGVAIWGANNPGAMIIRSNQIVDAVRTGIDLSSSSSGGTVSSNALTFGIPPSGTLRRGIIHPRGATVTFNTLTYLPGSQIPGTTEQPITGATPATVNNNTIDGL
jgi:hypothetical protein